MGFFQDLKEDLSTAVDEMEKETTDTTKSKNQAQVMDEVPVEEDEIDMDLLLAEAKGEMVEEPVVKQGILDETAMITKGMVIQGDLSTQGSLDMMGEIQGNIIVNGKLNVTGKITGNSEAGEVYADAAKINGEIITSGTIKVGNDSVIIGNITATRAVIAGAVKGDIDVKGPVILDASAIVMGNIKSKSVQIVNGAVIEGLCSQCYADVSPAKFFDTNK